MISTRLSELLRSQRISHSSGRGLGGNAQDATSCQEPHTYPSTIDCWVRTTAHGHGSGTGTSRQEPVIEGCRQVPRRDPRKTLLVWHAPSTYILLPSVRASDASYYNNDCQRTPHMNLHGRPRTHSSPTLVCKGGSPPCRSSLGAPRLQLCGIRGMFLKRRASYHMTSQSAGRSLAEQGCQKDNPRTSASE